MSGLDKRGFIDLYFNEVYPYREELKGTVAEVKKFGEGRITAPPEVLSDKNTEWRLKKKPISPHFSIFLFEQAMADLDRLDEELKNHLWDSLPEDAHIQYLDSKLPMVDFSRNCVDLDNLAIAVYESAIKNVKALRDIIEREIYWDRG